MADYVEAQTIPYRQVRELGEEVPIASRIIKVANAFDDLTGAATTRARSGRPTSASTSAWATSTTPTWSRRSPWRPRTPRWGGSGARTRRALASGAPAPPRKRSRGSPDACHLHRRVGIDVSIASLQGRDIPSPERESELWMGAHEEGPARTDRTGRARPRNRRGGRPGRRARRGCVARFGPRLPFLLKVLAPGRAISIQAHPSAEQAARCGPPPVTRSTSTTGPSPSSCSRSRRSRCSSGCAPRRGRSRRAARVPPLVEIVEKAAVANDPAHAMLGSVLATPADEVDGLARDVVAACVRLEATGDEFGRGGGRRRAGGGGAPRRHRPGRAAPHAPPGAAAGGVHRRRRRGAALLRARARHRGARQLRQRRARRSTSKAVNVAERCASSTRSPTAWPAMAAWSSPGSRRSTAPPTGSSSTG